MTSVYSSSPHTHNGSNILNITSINIQVLSPLKHLQLQQFIQQYKPSILTIQETKRGDDKNLKQLARDYTVYNLHSHISPHNTDQTTLIHNYVPHNSLSHMHIHTQYTSLHWFEVHMHSKHILLCSVYRSPNAPDTDWPIIANSIRQATQTYPTHSLLLMGDFNARLLSTGDNGGLSATHILHTIANTHHAHILNDTLTYAQPTHFSTTTHTTSIIDLVITNDISMVENMTITPLNKHIFTSDHTPIHVTLSIPLPSGVPIHTAIHTKWNTSKLNTQEYQQTMHTIAVQYQPQFNSLLHTPTQDNITKAAAIIQNIFTQSAKVACPTTTVKPGQKPWWNHIINRDTLYTTYKQSQYAYRHSTPATQLALKQLRNKAKVDWQDAMKLGRIAAHQHFIEQLDNNPLHNQFTLPEDHRVSETSQKRKLWWAHAKRMTKPSNFGIGMVSNIYTKTLPIDMHASLNNTAQYFQSISVLPPNTTPHHTLVTQLTPAIIQTATHIPYISMPFTYDTLDKTLTKLPDSSAGPDNIEAIFMRMSIPIVKQMIYAFYEVCWRTGLLPAQYTLAKVVPLHKEGSKTQASNYRPISITSHLIRTFERLLCPYYTAIILSKTTAYQAGFRANHSTSDNIARITEMAYRTCREGGRRYLLSLDLRKAFDTVWTDNLLYTLHHQFNIDSNPLLFLRAFLTNRQFFVVSDNYKSNTHTLHAGVPQGSVLAPILFLAYINSLAEKIKPHTSCALYADDTMLWSRSAHNRTAITQIKTTANICTQWCLDTKLNINGGKCAFMAITSARHVQVVPNIRLNNILVKYVRNMDILGITLHRTARTWDAQFKQLYTRTAALSHTISRSISRSIHTPPQPITTATLIKSILIPTITYGIALWRPTDTQINKLQSLIYKPLAQALHTYDNHVSKLGVLLENGIPPLHLIRKSLLLAHMHRTATQTNITQLSRISLFKQTQQYTHKYKQASTPHYARTHIVEAQHIAAQYFGANYLTPREWTKPRIHQAMVNLFHTQAQQQHVSSHILNMTSTVHPHSTKQLQPTAYLLHEHKPYSIYRAQARLHTLPIPYRLQRENKLPPQYPLTCPLCNTNTYCTDNHILLHCPSLTHLRTPIQQCCRKWRIKYNINTILGYMVPCTDNPHYTHRTVEQQTLPLPPKHPRTLQLLLLTGELIYTAAHTLYEWLAKI